MTDTNFASLSPGLLARKGGAKPAMRPQVAVLPTDGATPHNLEDLGWNDMGDEDEAPKDGTLLQLTPEPANADAQAEAKENDKLAEAKLAQVTAKKPVVVEQQEEIAAKVAASIPAMKPAKTPAIPAPTGSVLAAQAQQPMVAEPAPIAQPVVTTAPLETGPVDTAPIENAPVRAPRKRRSAVARGKRAAFTLRLDADRHLKLRLACTLRNKSAQQLVTEALDQLLGNMSDVNALAKQANSSD